MNLDQLFENASDIAKKMGYTDFVILKHAYSLSEKAKQEAQEDGHESERYWYWYFAKFGTQQIQQSIDDGYLRIDPHVHVFGLLPTWDKSQITDDIYVNIDNKKFTAFYEDENLEETMREIFDYMKYLLSHAVYDPNESKKMIRGYGKMSATGYADIKEAIDEDRLFDYRSMAQTIAGTHLGYDDVPMDIEPDLCEECEDGMLVPIWDFPEYKSDDEWCRKARRRIDFPKFKILNKAHNVLMARDQLPAGQQGPYETQEQMFDTLIDVIEKEANSDSYNKFSDEPETQRALGD